ncbi:MAG: hypothetical protein GYA33_15140 [Thermogutta sp.]|nr:hypothetical protein [Thermogutta sp.]
MRILCPPVAYLQDPAAAVLAEHWLRHKVPTTWHDLLWPSAVIADETLTPQRPSDYWNQQADLSTLRGVLSLCKG